MRTKRQGPRRDPAAVANMTPADTSSPAQEQGTRAVFFDLDGTLLDTAPDMAGALNALRAEQGLSALPFGSIRELVSHGANALVTFAFPRETAAGLAGLRDRFLELYGERLAIETRPFDGLLEALARLEAASVPWGVVTNKSSSLARPLLEKMGLAGRTAVLVGGDTLAERKPHPAPLLHAARVVGVAPARCAYIGDAERDMLAARAAGMQRFVALYGYIPAAERPYEWPATGWLESPSALTRWLIAFASRSA